MQLGVTFPTTEIGTDPGAIRGYVQAIEEMGYDYLLLWDHVLGADVSVRPGWSGRPEWGLLAGGPPLFNHTHPFHEPFVLIAFLASFTKRLRFATGTLILPQRQTALVAKQAAEVDLLSQGRLRLGIGTGWNDVEYEALGANWHDRGARCEEQIALMRALWTREVVTFEGKWHRVSAAGINPLPVQRPIPIWLGGIAEAVVKRVARLGDGWFPRGGPGAALEAALARMRGYAHEAGRDPSTIGLEGQVGMGRAGLTLDQCVEQALAWKALGATHLAFNTMSCGFDTLDQHLEASRRFKAATAPWA